MFGPELVYIGSADGAVADKHAYIESMRSGTVKYRAMRRSDVRVRTYGCLAMITGFFELDLTVRGGDLSEQARFHSVWAKRGQGVQFVSWQSTRVPPKRNLLCRQTPTLLVARRQGDRISLALQTRIYSLHLLAAASGTSR